MRLSDLIRPRAIVRELSGTDRDSVLMELVDALEASEAVSSDHREDLMLHLLKREAFASTGLGGGVAIPHAKVPYVRDFCGAVGLAFINTTLNQRLDLHLNRLNEHLNWGRYQVEETLARFAEAFVNLADDARLAALKKLSAVVRQEALVMAFADLFFAHTVIYLAMLALLLLMRRTDRT